MNRAAATRRRTVALLAGLVWSVGVGTVPADRLHLDGGGEIETDSWRIEGDRLFYDSPAGTIGIPRSAILKIEATPNALDSTAEASATSAAPRPPSGTGQSTRLVAPELARILKDGKQALDRRDFESAANLYRRALDLADGDFQLPRVGYALSQIALGEDEFALGIVLDGLARDPHHSALLELLGDLRNREERVDDALRSWRSAFDRSPSDRLRAKLEKAQRELHAARDYEFTTTSHFNVRYDDAVDPELAAGVMSHLEAQFWVIGEALDLTPRQPITVLLYPTRQFRDVTRSAEWVGGIYDGKIRVPLGGLKRLDPVAAGVLSHELTHAIVHEKTRGNCPRWLHEGLAQRFEGKQPTRADRAAVLEALQAGDPATWESRGFSYPLALSLTRYLEQRSGFHRVVDLLDELGDGTELDAALERIYGMNYATLCRRWNEQAGNGGDR